jgi:RNA polymerase sigma-70 factor (ECF subfamily)
MVYTLAYHYSKDSALAEDVMQEAFLSLYQNISDIESESHLVNWLRRVTVNLCVSWWRRNKARTVSLDSIPEPMAEHTENGPLATETILSWFRKLTGKTRMAMILRFLDDLKVSEIAEAMQESTNTVKKRLQRAKASIRQELKLPLSTHERKG